MSSAENCGPGRSTLQRFGFVVFSPTGRERTIFAADDGSANLGLIWVVQCGEMYSHCPNAGSAAGHNDVSKVMNPIHEHQAITMDHRLTRLLLRIAVAKAASSIGPCIYEFCARKAAPKKPSTKAPIRPCLAVVLSLSLYVTHSPDSSSTGPVYHKSNLNQFQYIIQSISPDDAFVL